MTGAVLSAGDLWNIFLTQSNARYIVVGLLLLMGLQLFFAAFGRKNRRSRRQEKSASRVAEAKVTDEPSPMVTSAAVSRRASPDPFEGVSMTIKPLLNRAEAKLLPVLEKLVRDLNEGHRVMAQTSMGEVLRPDPASADKAACDRAYRAFNAKRFDFLIINRYGKAVAAFEYQGHGHDQNGAWLRDAVKAEACRKAGLPLASLPPEIDDETLRTLATQLLKPGEGQKRVFVVGG